MRPTDPTPALRLGLSQCLAHWARYQGERPALITGSSRLTYANLDRRAVEAQNLLTGRVCPGERVAIVVNSKAEFIPWLIAINRAGCTAVICQPFWSCDQLGIAFNDNNVRVAVYDGDPTEITRPDGTPFDCVSALLPNQLDPRVPLPCRRLVTSECFVLFSSGTTGQPKGIVRTDFSLLNEFVCWCLELSLSRSTQFYIGRPLFYTGGLMLAGATLMAGGTVLAPQNHSCEEFVQLCRQTPPTYAFFVPPQIQELVRFAKQRKGLRLKTTILSMGDFIEPDVKEEAQSYLGCDIIESWGNSEGLGTITSRDDLAIRPKSIGRPFVGDQLIVVTEDGNQVATGCHGRIAGAADSCLSYYQSRDDLNRCLIKDGLVISEDLGFQDDEGYFYLTGRATDFVKRGSATVNVRDIERYASQLNGVKASCAVSIECEGGDPKLVVAVETTPERNSTREQLLTSLNSFLAPADRVDDVAIVPLLERNAAGKVIVDRVRESVEVMMRQSIDSNSR